MKKVLFAVLAIVAISFASCKGSGNSETTSTSVDSTQVDTTSIDSTLIDSTAVDSAFVAPTK